MNVSCDKSISCNPGLQSQGYDFPVANFSSEAPDANIFIGVNYGWDNNAPPIGTVWQTPGCISWCTSETSQDAADLCAARQQISCLVNNGGTPPPPPLSDGSSDPNLPSPGSPPITSPTTNPALYSNSRQSCSMKCPDGTIISDTVEAGEILARSAMLADQIAHSTACNRVAAKFICITALDGFACADPFYEDDEYKFQFSGIVPNPPVTWSVSGGSLPPSLTLEPSGLLHGIPDTAGDYNFTVMATNAHGESGTKACQFHVLGLDINNKALNPAKVDHPYSFPLPGKGGATTYWISDGSLPTGLTMSDGGVISGTPTVVGKSAFTVTVQDTFFNECTQDLTLEITGPKFTNAQPPDGVECTLYSFTFTATGTGAVTFSGSGLPCGLICDPSGLVHGYPCKKGSQSITITATDAAGHTNDKTWTINIATDGTGVARSVSDLGNWAAGTTTNSFAPLATVSPASISGGTIQINGKVFAHSGSQTLAYSWNNTLGRCTNNTSKPVTVDVVCVFNTVADPNIRQNIDIKIAGTTIHSQNFSITGFTAHVVIPVLSDSPTVNNCAILFELDGLGGSGPAQDIDCSLTISITQAP